MNSHLKTLLQRRQAPYVFTFILSVLFSLVAIGLDDLINNDGVYYMDAAKAFLREDLNASFRAYPWPFYSILIAFFHLVTGFSLEASARFLDTLFITADCLLFVKLYSEITDHKGSLWIAAIVIIAFSGINDYREDIMRDFGFWCFFFLSLLCMLNYYRQPRWFTAAGWQLSMLAAFLFRIEAIAIAALGPFLVLFRQNPFRTRLYQVFSLNVLYILGFIAILALFFVQGFSDYHVPLGRLAAISHYLSVNEFLDSVNKAVDQLGMIFDFDGAHSKYHNVLVAVLLASISTYIAIKIVSALPTLYIAALIYGFYKKALVLNTGNKIVLYFLLVNIIMLSVFVGHHFYIMPRHTIPLVFMLLLLMCQMLESLTLEILSARNAKRIIVVVIVVLFVQTGHSLVSIGGTPKAHVKRAGLWVRENVEASEPVVANNIQAMYYTDRGYSSKYNFDTKGLLRSIESNELKPDTYVIFYVHRHEPKAIKQKLQQLIAAGRLNLMKEFCNRKKDRTLILRVTSPSSVSPLRPPNPAFMSSVNGAFFAAITGLQPFRVL